MHCGYREAPICSDTGRVLSWFLDGQLGKCVRLCGDWHLLLGAICDLWQRLSVCFCPRVQHDETNVISKTKAIFYTCLLRTLEGCCSNVLCTIVRSSSNRLSILWIRHWKIRLQCNKSNEALKHVWVEQGRLHFCKTDMQSSFVMSYKPPFIYAFCMECMLLCLTTNRM